MFKKVFVSLLGVLFIFSGFVSSSSMPVTAEISSIQSEKVAKSKAKSSSSKPSKSTKKPQTEAEKKKAAEDKKARNDKIKGFFGGVLAGIAGFFLMDWLFNGFSGLGDFLGFAIMALILFFIVRYVIKRYKTYKANKKDEEYTEVEVISRKK